MSHGVRVFWLHMGKKVRSLLKFVAASVPLFDHNHSGASGGVEEQSGSSCECASATGWIQTLKGPKQETHHIT